MPPPSITDLYAEIKSMSDKLNSDNTHTEIELLKQKIEYQLSKEDVRKLIKDAFAEKDKATSVWSKPLMSVIGPVITALIVSYLIAKGLI